MPVGAEITAGLFQVWWWQLILLFASGHISPHSLSRKPKIATDIYIKQHTHWKRQFGLSGLRSVGILGSFPALRGQEEVLCHWDPGENVLPGSTSGKAHVRVLSRQTEQVFMALLFQVLVLCLNPLLQFAVNYHILNPVDVCTGGLICLFLIIGLQRLLSQPPASRAIVRNKFKLS